MNILVPDKWLREFLETKATPKQIKEYLCLCGPSVERIASHDGETVYDIQITTNRPDSMSIFGIAREAAAILPRFNVDATLLIDPYAIDTKVFTNKHQNEGRKRLSITTDPTLNPRWTSVVIDKITMGQSPVWMQRKLELTGVRPINIVVDVTNYLMRAYGQPAHAFDYDSIRQKNGVPTMVLRSSIKGEKLTTLDGKTHTLPGGDIVIEDGEGRLIDLCGIMGANNSAISETTKTVILFLQTYNPVSIRKTSMALGVRTDAAGLFEKGIDSELVLPAIVKGTELLCEKAGGIVASKLYDIYPKPYTPYLVSTTRAKLNAYMGVATPDEKIKSYLSPLGFKTQTSETTISVEVPSFRKDVTIDVDVIEEVARIHGYHLLPSKLPDREPPVVFSDPVLRWEEEVKVRLRDWGYTETYTFSMISEVLMNIFGLDTSKAYKITNPLSEEWVYMRPSLWPSILENIAKNLNVQESLKTFELSQTYNFRIGDLPQEKPNLVVSWVGKRFYEAKGLAQTLFTILGIPFPENESSRSSTEWYSDVVLPLGKYGTLGEVNQKILSELHLKQPLTMLDLDFSELVHDSKPAKKYKPLPKYPPVVEDLAFVVPERFSIGPLINALNSADPLIEDITLLDVHEDSRTLHVTFIDRERNLTSEDITPIREKLLSLAKQKFNVTLKGVRE